MEISGVGRVKVVVTLLFIKLFVMWNSGVAAKWEITALSDLESGLIPLLALSYTSCMIALFDGWSLPPVRSKSTSSMIWDVGALLMLLWWYVITTLNISDRYFKS